MSEQHLRELYQEIIFDHGMKPRHKGLLEGYEHCCEQFNPLCGDRVCVGIKWQQDIIAQAEFQGEGCAISMASTSLMLEAIQKKSQQQALDLVHHFFDLIYQRSESQTLGKIMILKGVCLYPARVKCATLAWHALQTLLGEQLNK